MEIWNLRDKSAYYTRFAAQGSQAALPQLKCNYRSGFVGRPGLSLDLSAGYFAIFYPEDAHMPGLAVEGPESVKKVVVKVRVD